MDRGAWWVALPGVAKSQTRLTTHTRSAALCVGHMQSCASPTLGGSQELQRRDLAHDAGQHGDQLHELPVSLGYK